MTPYAFTRLGAGCLLFLFLVACGQDGVQGTIRVEPGGKTVFTVTGMERTVVRLDGRGGPIVEMQVDDGERGAFSPSTRYRKVFTGTLSIVFLSEDEEAATSIGFHAESKGGVDVRVTQEP